MVLLGFLGERAAKVRLERLARAQGVAKVYLVIAEEARAQAPIGREADAVARPTVGVRHRGNDADAAGRARDAVVGSRPVAARRTTRRTQPAKRRQSVEDLRRGHHVLPREAGHLAYGHQLDEAHVPGVLEREPAK